jgi:hypothetical protein
LENNDSSEMQDSDCSTGRESGNKTKNKYLRIWLLGILYAPLASTFVCCGCKSIAAKLQDTAEF